MVSNLDLLAYEFSPETINYINHIRNSEPGRRVKSSIKNVPGFFTSKKMGFTIQHESHKVELPAIYLKEFDPNVLEYYDQPPSFKLNYRKGSKPIGHLYTADFFVIEKEWVGWEEWKSEEELIKLQEKNPYRYTKDSNGNWVCPPAEEYAAQWGLNFRVRTTKEICWVLQNNLIFLEDYLKAVDCLGVTKEAQEMITTLVKTKPGIKLEELLKRESEVYSADDIYSLLVCNDIYANLQEEIITETDRFSLFIDEETYCTFQHLRESASKSETDLEPRSDIFEVQIGIDVMWGTNLFKIVNMDEEAIWLLRTDNDLSHLPVNVFWELVRSGAIKGELKRDTTETDEYIREILSESSQSQLADANMRFSAVRQVLNGSRVEEVEGTPARTIRQWLKQYREADKVYGNGFIGLIAKTKSRGNRTNRIPAENLNLIDELVEQDYETIKQKNIGSVYRKYRTICLERGMEPVSRITFTKGIKKRSTYQQTKKRKGEKGAYFVEEFYYELEQTTPRHGHRPFQYCHIDHTEMDIELVSSKTGKKLGRPWLTIMTDAFSRRIIAFHISFDPPSYRACMMTIRECVRRYGRFPNTIIVDGGKEFHSVYFDTLLSWHNCNKKVRPGGKPRYGSVCERLFGTTNTMFLYNLEGNTQIMKDVRQVTKAVNPKNHAVWTLQDLHKMLEQWFYEVYDQREHSSLYESPRDAYVRSLKNTGNRSHTIIEYNENFIMLTLPSTRKGTAMFQPGRGIKINNFYYYSESLSRNFDLEYKQISVKYDPYNLGIAYAFVNKRWIKLTSEYYNILRNKTEKQLKIVNQELKQQKKRAGMETPITAKQIVDLMVKGESIEALRKQQDSDVEQRTLFTVIEGGKTEMNMQRNSMPDEKATSKTTKARPKAEEQESQVVDFPQQVSNPQEYSEGTIYGRF